MEFTLSLPEKEHLRLIADALERKASLETDEQLVSALIRKCMVRTVGKSLKLTDIGRRQLKD
ncbi:MAG TPA: hypothetical protein VM140_12995 [Burkholderiales bacterium]|nr:hypothetical protein [Burkholderiales bacterium]